MYEPCRYPDVLPVSSHDGTPMNGYIYDLGHDSGQSVTCFMHGNRPTFLTTDWSGTRVDINTEIIKLATSIFVVTLSIKADAIQLYFDTANRLCDARATPSKCLSMDLMSQLYSGCCDIATFDRIGDISSMSGERLFKPLQPRSMNGNIPVYFGIDPSPSHAIS